MDKKLKKHIISICVMAVALIAVVFASIATSTARFSTLISSDSSSKGAKWWVKVNNKNAFDTTTFDINLADTATANTNLKTGVVAPSSSGTFDLTIDCTGCEVDVVWTVEFKYKDAASTYPAIAFSTNSTGTTQNITIGTTTLTGEIKYAASNMSSQVKTITVNWNWPVNTTLDETEFSGKNYQYICVITASQKQA